jgi:hypothetical protein
MVDGLHILIQNRRKTPLAIAVSGQGGDVEGDLTNVQYQPNKTVTMNLLCTINTSY